MTHGNTYRAKANEFMAKAKRESNPALRLQYEQFAQSYLRLAEQADRNQRTDIVYETPQSPAAGVQQQQQQQQQTQPRKPED
jgi:hypothetical protein